MVAAVVTAGTVDVDGAVGISEIGRVCLYRRLGWLGFGVTGTVEMVGIGICSFDDWGS